MDKQLTQNEVSFAREIFLHNLALGKTQDFNEQMAARSIKMARLFYAAVDTENSHCRDFSILNPAEILNIPDAIEPFNHAEYANVKYSNLAMNIGFEEMACCFEKFDRFDVHKGMYRKVDSGNINTITCNYGEDKFIAHQYPEWVVAKAKNQSGSVYGFSTDNVSYENGIWISKEINSKICFLQYEECDAEAEFSLVSIDLPF